MGFQGTDAEKAECRQKWVKRLADELVKLEPLVPIRMLPEGEECPEWARKLELEIAAAMMPQAKVKEEATMTPQRMGALLGHECATAVWMLESLSQHRAAETEGEKTLGAAIELDFGAWYRGMQRLAKLALCSSVDQCFDDMRDFLVAFAKAFACKPQAGPVGNVGNLTFEIYVFMTLSWRIVAGLNSVRELHGLLIRRFGDQRTGELKRIEKMCQRIGLHYRKPGRPKKTATIQTP